MDQITNLLNSFNSTHVMRYFPKIGVMNIIEILIMTIVIYSIIKNLKGTRAWVLLKGVITLLVLYTIVYALNLDVIIAIFQGAIIFIGIAIVVILQPELRRLIEKIGTKNINTSLKNIFTLVFRQKNNSRGNEKWISDSTIQEIVKGCSIMSKAKTGVLIVIEREVPLNEYIESGIIVNADITAQLLINTFEKNTPLHDGAVIIRHDRLTAATCYLPLSDNSTINKDLGTRHRAGIGISECTDAVVVIVSEETGAISVSKGGELKHDLDREGLNEELKNIQVREGSILDKSKHNNDIKRLASRNIHLKLLSLVGAFITWVMVITSLNPITTTVLRSVPIELVNTELITSTGKTYDISNGETVNVTIKDRKDIVDRLNSSDIRVIADFSKLSYVNSIPLEYIYNGESEVTLSRSTMLVSLEDMITAEVDIEVERIGEANAEFYISDIVLDNPTVVISGAKSVINTIGSVKVQIDESKFTFDKTIKATPIILDKNGSPINTSKLQLNRDEVEVTVHLYKTKEVPIKVTPVIENDILSYLITNIRCQEQTVTITGDEELLNTISEIDIQIPISMELEDITQLQFIKTTPLQQYLDEVYVGVIAVPSSSRISLEIEFKEFYTKSISFDSKLITLEGLDKGYQGTISNDNYSIDIIGLYKNTEEKTEQTIRPYIDLTGLGEGTYELPVKYKDTSINAYDQVTATVTIERQREE